ncbi:MAG: putative Ig domain-containing protein, partial [Candidatus Cloacimonadales bacterium]
MKTNKLVIPLILLIMSWISGSYALQEATLIQEYQTANRVKILLPKVAMEVDDTLAVPLEIVGLSSEEVYSIYLKIAIDTSAVQVEDVLSGALTEGWNTPIWNIVNGELRISHYGVSPFTGSGNPLNILFSAKGEEGSSTELIFILGALNEGFPTTEVVDGRLFIGVPNPVIEYLGDTQYQENDEINLQINATDPLDKALSLSVMNLPAQATFSDNGAGSGAIAWETDYYSAGVYDFVITATNADNLSSQLAVSLIIDNIPQSPQFINVLEDITFQEDETYTAYYLPDYVVDSDLTKGDTLSVSITDNVNLNLAYADGHITFSAPADWFGTKTVTIVISDTYGFEISQAVVVNVINVNDEPIMLAEFPNISIDEDYLDYTLDLEDYFADLDNQLHYSVHGNENINFFFEGSVLNIQPHQDWFGT